MMTFFRQLMAKEAKVVEADYELKLEEAEKLIRRLRRDNDDQRKEVKFHSHKKSP